MPLVSADTLPSQLSRHPLRQALPPIIARCFNYADADPN